jgi:hypothetical protein
MSWYKDLVEFEDGTDSDFGSVEGYDKVES